MAGYNAPWAFLVFQETMITGYVDIMKVLVESEHNRKEYS